MLVLSVLTVYAETEKGAQITGKVIDASTKQGMEFANISCVKREVRSLSKEPYPICWVLSDWMVYQTAFMCCRIVVGYATFEKE